MSRFCRLICPCVLFALACGYPGRAATVTWGGPRSGDLNVGSSWSSGIAPRSASTTAQFGGDFGSLTCTTTITAGSFYFTSGFSSGTITVRETGTLNLGSVVNDSSFTPIFRITGGLLHMSAASVSLGSARYEVESGGTLKLFQPSNPDGSAATIVMNGGTLTTTNSVDSGTISLGSLAGTGTVNTGAASLVLGALGTSTTFSGSIGTAASVTKVGGGTWTLTGASTYAGATTISAGTVKINNASGSAFGTGSVTVAEGATLTGAGKFTGALSNLGTYAPGNSPALTTLSSFTQGSTGTLALELGGLTRGTGYDALDITGAATFGGTLTISLINDFNPATGATFNLFDWGSVTGTFNTINLPTLATGLSWNLDALYTAGEISVGASAIPEPSTYAAVLGAAALGFGLWRRGRQRRAGASGRSV
ncbi:autotransporter-associated beta strand repeat-containing protein [Opitutus terrae]|uniref:Autotransporter-associated beta strand repeat protein n=1 Tax=Opitutus terrae (strain DSM 11246 / JCM 15787 / PB90-1) TaxID=452637 RepID=B1ZNH1_OPITP|nr:autotransporter-associated beta strand repeat-containing protein [Opitutus terrae]ACB74405.1 autotransporter-associated beta strand repeat protein [Opitutus terrae PB90-1]